MIYVGENKSILCKGDYRPAKLYKGDKKIAGYQLTEFQGDGGVTLTGCYNDRLHDAIIEGNTIQNGEPTPETPVEIQSVGELVKEGDYAGKYMVLVKCRYENSTSFDEKSVAIYLDEPLRKLGDYADYIDFEKGVVVRKIRSTAIKDSGSWSKMSNATSNDRTVLYRYERNFSAKRMFAAPYGTKGNVLCNGLEHVGYGDADTDNSIAERVSPAGTNVIRILTSEYSTAAEMKAAFGELVFYYILDDAYMTEVAIDLPEIPTKYGCTNVCEIDTSITATISGKYKKLEE